MTLPEGEYPSVSGLQIDSRKVACGDTFVAVKGHQLDGRRFIDSAINAGATSVIADACEQYPHGSTELRNNAVIVYCDELALCLSEITLRVYGEPELSLIGVTGTNGKTTITQLIAQWLGLLDEKAAVMGTTGNGFLDDLKTAANTTGSAIEVGQTLNQLAKLGADYAAMEVSSHGLVQGRVRALNFKVGVFTNLSRDHLDYHQTMENYAQAKLSLFNQHQCEHAVINADDQVGKTWLAQLDNSVAVSLHYQPEANQVLFAKSVRYSEQGIDIDFDGSWLDGKLSAPLIGAFNASNVMLAFATLLKLGVDKQSLIDTAPKLRPVIGRMELFTAENQPKVVVDYAHTPDALEKALSALRVHCEGKLWAIFGCGGDRDVGKRPMMAEIAERLADHVILTDDNPRSESPLRIVEDMLAGMTCPENAVTEHDRYRACEYAIRYAQPKDIILLAGKGHEDYQVLGSGEVHYSDRETALQLLKDKPCHD
ncbi:UDP-N-acetylmuramoyl-L-alanyl-D-glutamate--2,6-diaminopimelate ligase [Vibrio sp. SCSIO 43136]|nr:UDP-N-acetylmuramoyl-L-alanyl-D-glutamate--2,6-diaminopimelate ligase [Vibrio sp. SCSIO 43136]